jgi:uncharacterized protein (TIGR02757 family)
MLRGNELKNFLESKYRLYDRSCYIDADPVSIPHLFTKPEDIEISGFLSATMAWGQRKTSILNMKNLLDQMDMSPYDFIIDHNESDLEGLRFVHRTFNSEDCRFFISGFKNVYKNHGGMKKVFSRFMPDVAASIHHFRKVFFEIPHQHRTRKHVADPFANSSAKRINMFLRWMVRKDTSGFDLGIWSDFGTENLFCPIDIHSGRVARKLGLLKRKQNDWKAVVELTGRLREFDISDPVKYDFALFGLGVYENF